MDWKNPDYVAIFKRRIDNLNNLRANPQLLPAMRLHYKHNPIDFINDWGVTYDPRLAERGLPAVIPLILFPRQEEFVEWVLERWRASESGLSDKSRDMGLSVVCQALAVTLCLFNDNLAIGFGSRKEDLVDKAGDPDCLFYKGQMFLEHLPEEFRGGYVTGNKNHRAHLKIEIPNTNSIIKGEAGDNIGRGGRSSIYFTDEDAFIMRPQLVDAALSQTTNCRISVSSVNGMDNPFAVKRWSWPPHRIFTFHWRSDPRKDDAWYEKQVEDLKNPIIVAQEIDLDYSASKEGVLIPSAWVQAAIDACKKLGFAASGAKRAGLDIADEGIDLNAWAATHGIELKSVRAWSGKGSDTFHTVAQAFHQGDLEGVFEWDYDADGIGALVRGDARVINEARTAQTRHIVTPFRGSGEVIDPTKLIVKGEKGRGGRTNKDFFANRKAQAWWSLRSRFLATYRAVIEGGTYDRDELISLDSSSIDPQALAKLTQELSQPTYSINGSGKILVDKAPDGQRSPNHADAVMIVYAPRKRRSGFGR